MAVWDAIVVGLGGVGSAAAYHLASAGLRVLGLDTYSAGHNRGSSHGETRIIRQAYFEHPNYVPMLRQAYALWQDLEEQTGEQLFHRTGIVQIGPKDGIVLPGIMRSAEQHGLDVEQMSLKEAARRWPGLMGSDDWGVAYEKNAGYLRVEACVHAHLRQAKLHGAELRHQSSVREWKANGRDVIVSTDSGTEQARHLVMVIGPWSRPLLNDLGVPVRILRKHQYWFRPRRAGFTERDGFPCYFYETGTGFFYGFPAREPSGMKVARHSGGREIDGPTDQADDPVDSADQSLVEQFLVHCLPDALGEKTRQAACYYTMTPDEHFIIDRLPTAHQVIVIAGLSGHGFKFTSVLGRIAMELITRRPTQLDLEFLGLDRFGQS